MTRVSVIGGCGFIGERLCARLAERGADVEILDANPKNVHGVVKNVDVRSADDLRGAITGNTIVNLAAAHRDDVRPRSMYDEVNVLGARNVCEAARQAHVTRIVFTSSVAVYGFAPAHTAEDGDIRPFNDYGRTKWEAECVYRAWQEEAPRERSLVIIRPTAVFGEGNRGNVFNLMNQIARGRFVMIGNGKNRKSLAYVENVAAFLEYCLALPQGTHVYNYVDKPDLTMNELVAECGRYFADEEPRFSRMPAWLGLALGGLADFFATIGGRSLPISRIRVKKFLSVTQFETAVFRTGFIPPVSILDGIGRTLRYEFPKELKSEE